ncbi:MAG: PHP-associated domain-containing protein, partial [Candidatus Limnocylindrales bacterium]
VAARIDYVEAWNARVPLAGVNERAREFAAARAVPGVAVSDAHSLAEVGVAYTRLTGPVRDAAELRAALAAATLVTGRASFVVRAMTPWAKLIQRLRGNRRADAVPARR